MNLRLMRMITLAGVIFLVVVNLYDQHFWQALAWSVFGILYCLFLRLGKKKG